MSTSSHQQAKKKDRFHSLFFVPKEGFEPSRGNSHYALNVARLPIPPLRLARFILRAFDGLSMFSFEIA
jgi:hypothetical protein